MNRSLKKLLALALLLGGCSAPEETVSDTLSYQEDTLYPSGEYSMRIEDAAYIQDVLYIVVEAKNHSPAYVYLNSWDFTLYNPNTLQQIQSFETFSLRLGVNASAEKQLAFEIPSAGEYELLYEDISFEISVG